LQPKNVTNKTPLQRDCIALYYKQILTPARAGLQLVLPRTVGAKDLKRKFKKDIKK
jgi:hypothetical protein